MPGVYAVLMDETADDGYPLAMRAVAVIGLFCLGALAFVLLDIMSDGKLTGGCTDCGDKAAPGA